MERRRRRSAYSAVRRFLWILPRKAMGTEGKVEMYHIHPSHRSHVVRNCTLSDEVHCTPTSAGFHDRPLWLSLSALPPQRPRGKFYQP